MNYKDVTQKEQPILKLREGNHSNCSFMEVRGLSVCGIRALKVA